MGGTTTNQIRLIGSSNAVGSFEFGIKVDSAGKIQVGDGGYLSLKGSGGGLYNGTGANNYGVELANAILTAGNGGSVCQYDQHQLVVAAWNWRKPLWRGYRDDCILCQFERHESSQLHQLHQLRRRYRSNSNIGVQFGVGLTMVNGSLNFLNVAGGGTSGSSSNFGLNISGVTVTAPVITGRDLAGGPGSGSNYGLNIGSSSAASQLGTSITNVLTISATSLGSGSNEYGINIFGTGGPSVVVGSGATMTLTGIGGGVYNGTGTLNHGIYLNSATLTTSGAALRP